MKNKIKLSGLSNYFQNNIDLFICSSSYEKRSIVIPTTLQNNRIKNAFICTNEDLKNYIDHNSTIIFDLFNNSNYINFNTKSPLLTADNFIRSLNKLLTKKKMSVVVDMTTFTHEGLLIVIKVLSIFEKNISSLHFLYNPAKDYSINSESINSKWLSKGLKNIRTVLGYPGKFNPNKKLHFIVLLGYEPERTQKLIDYYEPDLLSIGFGSMHESINKQLYLINKNKLKKFITIYKDIDLFEISCIDPFLTRDRIKEQITKYPDYNVVISPMNNKISTLGASLLAIENSDIQICYSTPNTYNMDGYSIASGDCLVFNLSNYWEQNN